MLDGVYQSVVSFFIPFIFVVLTPTAAGNGLDIAERTRLGCYIAHPAIFTINAYILINTYRWDWPMLLAVALSDIFVFFWTGVYTSTTYAATFYQAAPQVYQELTFWMCLLVTPTICLLPRAVAKCIQKQRFPYDVDIIREQAKQGQFRDDADSASTAGADGALGVAHMSLRSLASTGKASGKLSRRSKHMQYASVDEDRRPIYPPSVATHNTRTQNGSDGTTYIMQGRTSADLQEEQDLQQPEQTVRPSMERGEPRPDVGVAGVAGVTGVAGTGGVGGVGGVSGIGGGGGGAERTRPSYDRIRRSVDRVRPSFEASSDFTSAARLSLIEGTHSTPGGLPGIPDSPGQRRFNLTTVRKRGLSAFSKKSIDP